MALIKPGYHFRGLNVQNAYLRISNLEYLYADKKVAYLISATQTRKLLKGICGLTIIMSELRTCPSVAAFPTSSA